MASSVATPLEKQFSTIAGLDQMTSSNTQGNTAISITVALPAAYAFSRYRFLGDKHVFFWLLTNRMTRTKSNAEFLMSMNLS